MKLSINEKKYTVALANSGLTVKQFAERAGLTRQRIYAILNSKRVTSETAGRIAKALGVDVTEIID